MNSFNQQINLRLVTSVLWINSCPHCSRRAKMLTWQSIGPARNPVGIEWIKRANSINKVNECKMPFIWFLKFCIRKRRRHQRESRTKYPKCKRHEDKKYLNGLI